MVDQARARRLAKRITQIVADALEHEVKDPRLAMVTITDTRVTGDLREATVYYTVLGETVDATPDTAAVAAAFTKATGVLRSKVGAGTGIRYTPSLAFVADIAPDEARRMEELLARTRERVPPPRARPPPAAMPAPPPPVEVLVLGVRPAAAPAAPDVLVACDAAEPARLGDLSAALEAARVSIMIDHHVSNPGFGGIQ